MEVSNKRKARSPADERRLATVDSRSVAGSYDAYYYAHNCGRPYERDQGWLSFFDSIAERIVSDIGPATALDAGCAMGFLVEGMRARQIDAQGIDISEYAISKADASVQPYCWVGSLTEPLPQHFDLIVCIEVLEHLPPFEADQAIENLCKHTEDILFSSTPFDYKEATHFNVRPPDYWAQKFAQQGFYRDLDFDSSFITPWAMRFRKTHDPAWRVVCGYERQLWQLEKEIQARRLLTIEQEGQLAEREQQLERVLADKAVEEEKTAQMLAAETARHQEAVGLLTTSLSSEQDRAQTNIATLTAQLNEEREQTQQLQSQLIEEGQTVQSLTAEIAQQQRTVESLNLTLRVEREQSQRLAEAGRLQIADQVSTQLAEQYEKLDSLIAPVAASQNSLGVSVARLLETRDSIDGLVAQVAAQEKTILALSSAVASKEEMLAQLRAQSETQQRSSQALAAQVVECENTIETLSGTKQESELTIADLSLVVATQEQTIRALRSRARGTELAIQALSQRRTLDTEALATLSALVTTRDARLLDIDSSLVWYLYNRLKYPYLQAFYRLYERIKYPYLLSLYRRFGLAAQTQTTPEIAQAEVRASLPETRFPVSEVIVLSSVTPHAPSVDVIVCVHNALADVKRCLESVICNTRMPYSLILVDDGSDDQTRAYLAAFARSQDAVLIRNEQAKGYTLAANQGLRRSQGSYSLLLNSDTVVTPLWLDQMVACGESDSQIGLVGPLSNVASWQSIPELLRDGDWAENKLPEGISVAEMGKLLNAQSARLYPRIPFLNGFCLLIKRKVIEQIGYFDEAVFGKGYGEENDYCLRARQAGWELSVADSAYVYHAQSRSYSHERRKELSKHADLALRQKHDPETIVAGVTRCRFDRVLEGIRVRSRVMFERKALIEAGRRSWEGRRVAFILPIASACGGGNVVLDEAATMREMGVEVCIINLSHHRDEFERSYPDNTIPVLYADSEARIRELSAGYDAAVATYCGSVYWLDKVAPDAGKQVRAYYIQDFEPHFFTPEMPEFRMAWNSYTEHPDLIRFTKTEWNREIVKENTGADCLVVGPSVNLDLYRPRRRRDPEWPVRPLRVAAMIRPSTPRRNAQLTMEVLREYQRDHGATVEIILFGCESADPEFLKLPGDFSWRNAGVLTRPRLAFLLNEVDVFVDFSEFQAMGLTAMEAMASGVAVILPQKGGAQSFASHEKNALIVDTDYLANCLESLERITMDEDLRSRLQRQALIDACENYPEKAAYNMLKGLFRSTL